MIAFGFSGDNSQIPIAQHVSGVHMMFDNCKAMMMFVDDNKVPQFKSGKRVSQQETYSNSIIVQVRL